MTGKINKDLELELSLPMKTLKIIVSRKEGHRCPRSGHVEYQQITFKIKNAIITDKELVIELEDLEAKPL